MAGLRLAVVVGAGLAAAAGVATGEAAGLWPVGDPSLVFAVPHLPRPAYLKPMTDPVFGTRIIRITGDTGRPIPWTDDATTGGTWAEIARHHYSDDQPWNSDGTLLMLQNHGGSPGRIVLDGEDYRPRFTLPKNYDRGDDRWHPGPQHPHERINLKGHRLEWFDIVRGVQTRCWALPFAARGDLAGNPSRSGRFAVLTDAPEGSATGRMIVVDMNPQPPHAPYPNRRIGPVCDLFSDTGLSNLCLDWAAISPSGRYAVVLYNSPTSDLPRVYDVNPDTLALSPRPMTTSHPGMSGAAARGFLYDLGHPDMTQNPFDNDEDVLVGQEHARNAGRVVRGKLVGRVLMVRLKDGAITPLTDPDNEAYPFHISARNFDRPGWIYVSYYPAAGKRFNDEILALKLDGSKSVERLGHTHSDAKGLYRAEPHAVPSRDGRRVLFASNWARQGGSPGVSRTDIKTYVVDARGK